MSTFWKDCPDCREINEVEVELCAVHWALLYPDELSPAEQADLEQARQAGVEAIEQGESPIRVFGATER